MTRDPLDELLLDRTPARPSERFVASLRARLEAALGTPAIDTTITDLPTSNEQPERTATMATTSTTSTDAGDDTFRSTLNAYIGVSGAAEAIAWYGDVFGAVETVRYTGDDGRIGHAELNINGAMLMLSDEYPDYGAFSPTSIGGTPVTLHLVVADVDAVHAKAAATGATIEREPSNEAYGARSMAMRDPFGHRWMVQTPIENPTVEEIQARTDDFTITTNEPEPPDA